MRFIESGVATLPHPIPLRDLTSSSAEEVPLEFLHQAIAISNGLHFQTQHLLRFLSDTGSLQIVPLAGNTMQNLLGIAPNDFFSAASGLFPVVEIHTRSERDPARQKVLHGTDLQQILHVFRSVALSSNESLDLIFAAEIASVRSWFRESLVPLTGEQGQFIHTLTDITQEKLTLIDELTGCLRKDPFLRQIEPLFQESTEHCAVIFLDFDRFKRLNTTLGHLGADTVIQQAVDKVKSLLRPSDYIARYGGDEFVLVIFGISEELARQRAEAIRRAVKELEFPDVRSDLPIQVTTSIGLETVLLPQNLEAVLKAANRKLLAAKAMGGNRVCTEIPKSRTIQLQIYLLEVRKKFTELLEAIWKNPFKDTNRFSKAI